MEGDRSPGGRRGVGRLPDALAAFRGAVQAVSTWCRRDGAGKRLGGACRIAPPVGIVGIKGFGRRGTAGEYGLCNHSNARRPVGSRAASRPWMHGLGWLAFGSTVNPWLWFLPEAYAASTLTGAFVFRAGPWLEQRIRTHARRWGGVMRAGCRPGYPKG